MPVPLARALALLGCGLIVLVGCSDDPEPSADDETSTTAPAEEATTTLPALDPGDIEGGEQAYIDALIASYEGTEGGPPLFSGEQATCLAESWVDSIGLERFAGAGLTPEALGSFEAGLEVVDIPDEVADEMIGALDDCEVDVAEAMLQSLGTPEDLPPELSSCVDAAITEDVAKELLRGRLLGAESNPEAAAPLEECLASYRASIED